jgi:hypothetical protein
MFIKNKGRKNSMRKSMLVFLILLIIVLFGCKKEIATNNIEAADNGIKQVQGNFMKDLNNNMVDIFKNENTSICLSVISSNTSFCDESSNKEGCYDKYYFYKTILSKNSECENIITPKLKVKCEEIKSGTCTDCGELLKLKSIVQSGVMSKCEDLEYDDYVLCKSAIQKDNRMCITETLINKQRITQEICSRKNLSMATKTFCKKSI